jgi:hypothetical protein
MAVHQLEITTENLLNAVAQMPESEFNRFVANAKKLRTNHKNSTKEIELIHKINTVFENFPRQRYNELNAKFKADALSKSEYEELLGLSDRSEILNAERLGYIAEIAGIRHETLEDVMRSLGIKTTRK